MKSLNRARIIMTWFCLLALCGCATIKTVGEPETKNKIYSGTIRHIELKCAHGVCLDMPFSLVADTKLLPVTIPWTAYNYVKGDEKKKQTKQNGKDDDRDKDAQQPAAADRR